MRTYEGRIGIFLNDSEVPIEELDVDVGLLPEADQVLLEEGIRVTDREHLNRLIEDYES
ncbi:MAG: BofC C-terminal domain-containing protein [Anaeromassilibacillus sp.]